MGPIGKSVVSRPKNIHGISPKEGSIDWELKFKVQGRKSGLIILGVFGKVGLYR